MGRWRNGSTETYGFASRKTESTTARSFDGGWDHRKRHLDLAKIVCDEYRPAFEEEYGEPSALSC